MKNNNINTHQQGMTLIEIMIALVIGAFMLTGVVQVFTGSKQTYRMQDNLSRMQENARFAMEFISRDIRMADYWGCLDGSNIENKLNPSSDFDGFASGIGGADNDASDANIVDGTDSITLRGMSTSNTAIESQNTNTQAVIKVVDDSGLEANDIVIISNCIGGDLFQITNVTAGGGGATFDNVVHNTGNADPGNASSRLETVNPEPGPPAQPSVGLYGPEANIAKLIITDYQIHEIPGVPVAVPVLSRSINGGNFQSLVSDIENMQILYGEDTDADGTPNHYALPTVVGDATTVTNMDNVVSVRVSLLIRSTDNNLTIKPRAYTYNGASITPTDRRLRRVFTSTIVLRNRLQ